MDIPILYEDEHVVAVNKPTGLVVHGDGRSDEATLVDWVIERYPQTHSVGEPLVLKGGAQIARPGIVHRLDRETSGAMVVAKTAEGHAHLKEQFQVRRIEKEYRAFTYGHWSEKAGLIEKAIGRSPKDFRRWSAQPGARGELRDAATRYSVLAEGKEASYLALYPQSGRTHQIRVHCKAMHHSVVCDKLYAPKQDCILGFERLALHAYSLSFETLAGERVAVEAPLPADFEVALAGLGARAE